MVAHLVGTPYFPRIDGGILFLEDVGETPYRIERMLYQLHHAGVLARQRAILLGQFTEYALVGNDGGYDLDSARRADARVCAMPILTGLPFGHVPDKLTLPVGGQCALDVRGGARDAGVLGLWPLTHDAPFAVRVVDWARRRGELRAVRLRRVRRRAEHSRRARVGRVRRGRACTRSPRTPPGADRLRPAAARRPHRPHGGAVRLGAAAASARRCSRG